MNSRRRFVSAVINALRRMRYMHRRTAAFVVYAIATASAYASAFMVRFEFSWPASYTATFFLTLPLLLLVRQSTHLLFRLTTSRWRFVGVQDLLRLAGATSVGTILFLPISQILPIEPTVPISIVVIEAILCVLYTSGIWICYRIGFETVRYRQVTHDGGEQRVLIVGAGESGYILAREMLRSATSYRPIGFVDDDPHKWGTRLAGLEVIGSTDDLPSISATYRIDELILAVPQATPAQMRVLVEKCTDAHLPYRVLPSIAEVLAGNVRMDQIREVRIDDLLGRDPVQLDLLELAEDLKGGCALITGAAGSIGSELSRQIARHSPDVLLLLDQAETALFYLEIELRERYPSLHIVPIVCDIVDRSAIEGVFRQHSPTHVYHAAAYKHVPLMESNVGEAVRNNVIGSYIVADAAGRHASRKCVLVSTDKAVRPSSVMGASKRLAEIATLELQERYPVTAFAAVRFGNVLGSNGSVVPLFKRQIASGKPLTVTHPEVTRYFMTIRESVQLILQGSLLPEIRGHVAMLEMGEPVKILDLAKNLLRLSGIRDPNRIVFTGMRPGEKLHEELVAPEEETVETAIRKVRIIKSGHMAPRSVLTSLTEWELALMEGREADLLASLEALFPGLAPYRTEATAGDPIAKPRYAPSKLRSERSLATGSDLPVGPSEAESPIRYIR